MLLLLLLRPFPFPVRNIYECYFSHYQRHLSTRNTSRNESVRTGRASCSKFSQYLRDGRRQLPKGQTDCENRECSRNICLTSGTWDNRQQRQVLIVALMMQRDIWNRSPLPRNCIVGTVVKFKGWKEWRKSWLAKSHFGRKKKNQRRCGVQRKGRATIKYSVNIHIFPSFSRLFIPTHLRPRERMEAGLVPRKERNWTRRKKKTGQECTWTVFPSRKIRNF